MKTGKNLLLAALPLILALGAPAGVTPGVTYRFEPGGFKADSTRLIVHVSLPQGWHIQSDAPLDSFLIPTTLSAEGPGLIFGKPVFPEPLEKDFPALGGKVALFEGAFDITVPVRRENARVKADVLKSARVRLGYQACNDTQCLPPKTVEAVPEKK